MMYLIFLLSMAAACLADHKLHVYNRCSKEIWVGVLGNAGKPIPLQGGFRLYNRQSRTITVPDNWGGRVWGRTGCGGSRCETGDCGGGRLQCSGAGGIPPATLAEITFDGAGNRDFYDVSLVDGFNVKMSMKPTSGTHDPANRGRYFCGTAGCNFDINTICPNGMKVYGTGGVVACKSACLAFGNPEYCCTGAHNTPQTCPIFQFAQTFKNVCPDAYSYAYDDRTSTFTCRRNDVRNTEYDVYFC